MHWMSIDRASNKKKPLMINNITFDISSIHKKVNLFCHITANFVLHMYTITLYIYLIAI